MTEVPLERKQGAEAETGDELLAEKTELPADAGGDEGEEKKQEDGEDAKDDDGGEEKTEKEDTAEEGETKQGNHNSFAVFIFSSVFSSFPSFLKTKPH